MDRRRILLGLAMGHLVLAALGAGAVSLRPLGPLGRLLEAYAALSGADGGDEVSPRQPPSSGARRWNH